MSLYHSGFLPRLKPLSSRKSATLSVLDIGTSKIVCLVAQLKPVDNVEAFRGRTHVARIIGIGHQRSLGLKGGAVVDLEAAEGSIRQAVHAAERMAKVEIQSVIVNLTGGRLNSHHLQAHVGVRGGAVANAGGQQQAATVRSPGEVGELLDRRRAVAGAPLWRPQLEDPA